MRVLHRFDLCAIIEGPSSHAEMLLDHAEWDDDCDCLSCQNGGPSIADALQIRHCYVAIRLGSADDKAQSEAQTSELAACEDTVDERNCYCPRDDIEIGTTEYSDRTLANFRRAVETLRLKAPSTPVRVNPVIGPMPTLCVSNLPGLA